MIPLREGNAGIGQHGYRCAKQRDQRKGCKELNTVPPNLRLLHCTLLKIMQIHAKQILKEGHDTYSILSSRAASLSVCGVLKKSLQGLARFKSFAKFPMLKSEGMSVGFTSDQCKGVEMGAFLRLRTE